MTMTRQGFVRLLFVATGTAAFTAACGDDGAGGSGAAGSGGSGGAGASGGDPSTGGTTSSPTTTTMAGPTTTTGGMLNCEPTIAFNHGHDLTIPAADLDSAADKTYDITGASPHSHMVTFTGAQLASLKAGDTVMVTSTAGGMDQHTHNVSVSC